MNGALRRRLTIPPLLALSLLGPALSVGVGEVKHQPVEPLDLGELEQARHRHHAVGQRVGRRLGMTTTWARTRWVPGHERGEVLPLFHVTVAAARPTKDVRDVIIDRLQNLGWDGRLAAYTEDLRIEGQRGGTNLLLLADGTTITLTLSGPSKHVGRTQVLHLISGVYEDEEPDL